MPGRKDDVHPGRKHERNPAPIRNLQKVRASKDNIYAEKQRVLYQSLLMAVL